MSCKHGCNGRQFLQGPGGKYEMCLCHPAHPEAVRLKANDLDAILQRSGVPAKYRRLCLVHRDSVLETLASQGYDLPNSLNASVAVYGLNGRGKTVAGTVIFLEMLLSRPGANGLWVDMNEWLLWLKSGSGQFGEPERREFESRQNQVIMVDDLGAMRGLTRDASQGFFRWQEPVTRLIRWCDANEVPLITTSNLLGPKSVAAIRATEKGRDWVPQEGNLWPSGLRLVDPSVEARMQSVIALELSGKDLRRHEREK